MKFTVIAAGIAALFSFLLGIFAVLKNPHGIQNRKFALFNIALALWNIGEISSAIGDHRVALYIYRLSYIGASFLAFYVTGFFWSVVDFHSSRQERVFKWLAVTFAIISPTNLIIRDISIDLTQLTPIEEVHGPFYYPFMLYFVCGLIFSLIPVIFAYKKSNAYVRNQLRYITVAMCIGLLGTLNYIASQIYDKVPPFYCFIQMCICATFAAAILKHRLMDISVIIRKTLIYSVVMGTLTIVYLMIVTIFARLFEGLAGYQTVFSSAVGAVIITLFFQPLRKKVQIFVDTRFFRQFVDREEKLYELSRDVITHTTPEAMAQALMRVLGESFHPKRTALYLKQRDGASFVLAAGVGGVDLPQAMPEDNALAQHFLDHPQPFIEDAAGATAQPQSTRDTVSKDRNVA